MQNKKWSTELLVLSGIHADGQLAWIFVPGDWNIAELEREYVFSGVSDSARRKVTISVAETFKLIERYGVRPLLNIPGERTLPDLMAEQLGSVRMLIARDQDVDPCPIPL